MKQAKRFLKRTHYGRFKNRLLTKSEKSYNHLSTNFHLKMYSFSSFENPAQCIYLPASQIKSTSEYMYILRLYDIEN